MAETLRVEEFGENPGDLHSGGLEKIRAISTQADGVTDALAPRRAQHVSLRPGTPRSGVICCASGATSPRFLTCSGGVGCHRRTTSQSSFQKRHLGGRGQVHEMAAGPGPRRGASDGTGKHGPIGHPTLEVCSDQAEELSNFLDTSGYLKFSPFFHRMLGYQLLYRRPCRDIGDL